MNDCPRKGCIPFIGIVSSLICIVIACMLKESTHVKETNSTRIWS